MRRLRRRMTAVLTALLLVTLLIPWGLAEPAPGPHQTTVLFTHDLHSHFLPLERADGGESGGYARLASALEQQRALHPDALTLDGGDFSIGSLVQTLYTTRAAEAAGLTPEALKMEVQRSFRRMAAKEKKTRERRELNPAVSLQPQERGLRYDNLRSALAEEGVIRLLLLDDSLFGDTPPVPAESFSSPLLGRVYASLWESHMAGRPLSISSLSGELTGEEMSHLTGVVQKPESPAGGERALTDYCRVIREEAQKRTAGAGTDPLAAAAEKYKNKKGYGGKHNDG